MHNLDELRSVLKGQLQLLIIPHNDPDPDAIASAVGLRFLVAEMYGIKARNGYCGIIGRAENKALVRYLDHPLQLLDQHGMHEGTAIALVDIQPDAGNNPLPEDIPATIVIDHHVWKDISAKEHYADVRSEIGATATILTEYLRTAALNIPSSLATALFYGIKTDTMGLGRGASPIDVEAYFYLQPKIDVGALVQIENAQVLGSYLKRSTAAIQAVHLYDDDLIISYIRLMSYPDLGAEIAHLLFRLQGVRWVICIGVHLDDLILSVRSRSRSIGAGDLMQFIIGDLGSAGRHGTMAGSQIRLNGQDPTQLANQLTKSALLYLKEDASMVGKPMI